MDKAGGQMPAGLFPLQKHKEFMAGALCRRSLFIAPDRS